MGIQRLCLLSSVIPLGLALVGCGEARLDDRIQLKELRHHLAILDAIGKHNDGTRESGSNGHIHSLLYVKRVLGGKYQLSEQSFEYRKAVTISQPVLESVAPNPKDYVFETDYESMEYSGSGDVTAELVAIDVQMPPAPEPGSTSGCEAADFVDSAGASLVTGKIALVQRGTCNFSVKAVNAQAAGAVGVIIYNEGQPGRVAALSGTLGNEDTFTVPVVGASFAVGEELYRAIQTGPVSVRVKTETEIRTVLGRNLLAESGAGNPDSIVFAGAHLDSVHEGPGINDNGSGSVAILEIARQLAPYQRFLKNKVRFAFWDAEESGLIGSLHYTSALPAEERAKIKLYLNLDMIASPNYGHFVYNSTGQPEGSKQIEELLTSYFVEQGLASEAAGGVGGRSDHAGFADLGIPVGGLFTGAEGVKTPEQVALYGGTAGVSYDACYHKACDDLSNVNWQVFERMSKAGAFAVGQLASASDLSNRVATRDQALARNAANSAEQYRGPRLIR